MTTRADSLEGMTETPQQDDLSHEADDLVERTDNGLRPEDPDEQPSQDPAELPEGTETEQP